MEDVVLSLTRHMADLCQVKEVYFREVEDGFTTPSLYAPPVDQKAFGDTLTTFRFDNSIFYKVFAETTQEAMETARKAVFQVQCKKLLVPLFLETGEEAGSFFRLKNISHKKVDDGVAQIHAQFLSVHQYDVEDHARAERIYWNTYIKQGGITYG